MWSPNELLKIEKQRDILSYITLQFFHFKKVPLEHCPLTAHTPFCQRPLSGNCHIICFVKPVLWTATRGRPVVRSVVPERVFSRLSLFYNFLPLSLF